MKWIEIITLRTAGKDRRRLVGEVVQKLPHELRPIGLTGMKIYDHAVLDTDLSIHLLWDSIAADKNGSGLALRIVDALLDFGLVHHGIWMEQSGRKP
jgi:hypothetical protein